MSMKVSFALVAVCLLGFAWGGPHEAWAQDGDPFGAQDPFQGGGAGDPFGGRPAAKKPAVKPKVMQQKAVPGKPAQGKAAQGKAAQGKPAPGKADGTRQSSAVEDRLREAMKVQTSFTFVETPLEEAVRMISRVHELPMIVDRRALEEIGLTPDSPVNLDLKDVRLRSFVRLMLRELELAYVIKDEVIRITTAEAAESDLVLRMYPVPKSLAGKSDKIIKAMQASVVPDAWNTAGGPASVTAVDHVLAVSATEAVHLQVEAFLVKLKDAYEKHQAKSAK